MYAILFDLDTNCLSAEYEGATYHNAYKLLKDFMIKKGFTYKQGSVYCGNADLNAVDCVLIVQELAKLYPFFAHCAKDIRMLRIEEDNDLMPAINAINK